MFAQNTEKTQELDRILTQWNKNAAREIYTFQRLLTVGGSKFGPRTGTRHDVLLDLLLVVRA